MASSFAGLTFQGRTGPAIRWNSDGVTIIRTVTPI